MKRLLFLFAIVCSFGALGLVATHAQAQRPGGPEGAGREGGARQLSPLITALDTNGDGVIDQKEMANAPAALKKLDKNGDGKLTEDEYRPTRGQPAAQSGRAGEDMITRLMEFDKNADGKLSKDELPERMQALMERGDANKDGFLTLDEIRKMAEQQTGLAGGEGREGRKGGERPRRPAPPPE